MGIIILGGTGVGKSTVGTLISQKTGYPLYEVGHIVKQVYLEEFQKESDGVLYNENTAIKSINEIVKIKGKQLLTQNRLEFTKQIVKKEGNDYFVRVLLERHPEDRKIIVGVRSFEEIATIDFDMKNPFYVGLMCQEDRLLKRFTNRERMFMNEAVAKDIFIKRYDIEHSWGVDDVLSKCNVVLQTDYYSPEELAEYIIIYYGKFLEDLKNV